MNRAVVAGVVVAIAAVTAVLPATLTFAVTPATPASKEALCRGAGGTWGGSECSNAADKTGGVDTLFKTVTDVVLFLTAAVAVVMIIIGGLRYTTSGGDQAALKNAKNTILYAVIGLIVAILAYGAINFVIQQVAKP